MMIVHSQWRVKVAISVVFFFTLHLANGQSISNNSFGKKVSIKGQGISFETVLDQLSVQTKLYFIYSSNAVELNKRLSLNLEQRPLYEVLEQLGEIMHLSFRQEGNYVVVKALAENKIVSSEKSFLIQKQKVAKAEASKEVTAVDVDIKKYVEIEHDLSIPDDLLKKNLLNCPSDFTGLDASHLKKYFPLKITTPRPRRQVFTSFGLMLNEYSGGVEVRVGIPSLYAVINAGLMQEGYFRSGYGIGTSIPIKPMVSLNPVYTFANVRQRQDYIVDENINLIMMDGLKVTGKHHQMKFLFQLQLSKRITMHVGPTVNFLKATYTYPKDPILFTEIITASVSSTGYYYSGPSQVRISRSTFYVPPPDYTTFKSWVGFEGGISYSIKFPRR